MKNKILYGIIAIILIAGIVTFFIHGFNIGNVYGSYTKIGLYIETGVNKEEVTQNVNCTIDSTKTLAIANVLWHKISFTSRFNNSPKALPQKNGSPMFCGRIFAINGDFTQLIKEEDDYEKQMDILLANEIASLYIPAEKNQGTVMTIRHKGNQELYISQLDAPREFLLKVIEIVCAGGEFHKQNNDKSGFLF